MQQPMFPAVYDACIADIRNRILDAWRAGEYSHGNHKANSLAKHLGVRKLSECEDLDELELYLQHVEGKKWKKR